MRDDINRFGTWMFCGGMVAGFLLGVVLGKWWW